MENIIFLIGCTFYKKNYNFLMNKIADAYLESFKLYLDVEKNFSQHTVCAYSSDILSFLIWLDNVPFNTKFPFNELIYP